MQRLYPNARVLPLVVSVVLCAPLADVFPDDPIPPQYVALVRALGSSDYHARDRAARELVEIGLPAKPTLMQATRDQDPEVRSAARRILVSVLQADFDAGVAAFLDTSRPELHELNGWKRFQEQVGDVTDARQLYASMMRAESAMLDACARQSDQLPQICATRIQALTSSMPSDGTLQFVSEASLASLLFVGAQLDTSAESVIATPGLSTFNVRLYNLLSTTSAQQIVLQETHSALLRQLLIHWIEQGWNNSQRSYAMQLVLKYELSETGLKIAHQLLESPDAHYTTKPYAAIVIARFGGPDDAQCLLPHLEDRRVFHTWSNPALKKEPISIQVRDVVLAMLIRATGQEPDTFGFEHLDPFPETLYRIWTFGFLEDEERAEAMAKWEHWMAAHGAEFDLVRSANTP